MKIIKPNYSNLFRISFLMMISIFLFIGNACAQESRNNVNYTIVPDFPSTTTVCNEKIDLSRYDMYERYDRELTSFSYTHNLTLSVIKRANRYFPIIAPILKEEGIPDDMIYLMAIESSMNTRALSPAKAAGIWQIMESTGRELGLEVNSHVDERYNIEKATRAAAKYLKKSYSMYGDWMAVAASYNAGQRRITSELEKQKADNVFDLWLNEETSRYPFRIMAIKEIMNNPSKYGFILKRDQLYKPIRTRDVEITTEIPNLADFAKENGLTYAQLKDFNPWLRDRYLPNKRGKKYIIKIPYKEDLYYNSKNPTPIYNENWVVD